MTVPAISPSPSQPNPSVLAHEDARDRLASAFRACRDQTLALFDGLSDRQFREQIHPGYSPLGWHLGHIAYTEAHWLVHLCGNNPLPFPELEKTFHVEGLPKHERSRIPPRGEVLDYVAAVRRQMLHCLHTVDLAEHEKHFWFVLQHECQHAETVTLLTACRDESRSAVAPAFEPQGPETLGWHYIPAGPYRIGSEAPEALDNEGPPRCHELAGFQIAAGTVTQAQYAAFISQDGYATREHWSDDGWAWRTAEDVSGPLYWQDGAPERPVHGISAHEADAWCAWAGLRLPSEFEWEAAAQHGGDLAPLAGGVWQWTASTFDGYPGFAPWPYPGYSQAYFDGQHRVLRGGSHATRPWATRTSFRNWYLPDTRQIFSGLRPVKRDEDSTAH